jgi:hypothetical protein
MNHTMPGIMWALVRQQIQVEAIISALAMQQPSLPEHIMTQLESLRTSGRVKEIIAEVYEQVNQAADGAWLSRHGISDPSTGK